MAGYRKDSVGFSKEGSKGSDPLPELTNFKNGVLEAWLTELESKIVKSEFGEGYRKTLDLRDLDDTLGS